MKYGWPQEGPSDLIELLGACARDSKGQVGVEVRRSTLGHELITPRLLCPWPVECPDGLAHGVQALECGERLFWRPVGRHAHRWRRVLGGVLHDAALRPRGVA